eukprot:7630703-Alexandrium_andersonii.AAC.1
MEFSPPHLVMDESLQNVHVYGQKTGSEFVGLDMNSTGVLRACMVPGSETCYICALYSILAQHIRTTQGSDETKKVSVADI